MYLRYKDVVDKYGEAIAKSIRDSKKELEKARQAGEDEWVMAHPEVASPVPGLNSLAMLWLRSGSFCGCGTAWFLRRVKSKNESKPLSMRLGSTPRTPAD